MMSDPCTLFADAAVRYCDWCESAPGAAVAEAKSALAHVAELYRLGLDLRELEDAPEVDCDSMTHEQWTAMFQRFGCLPFNFYTAVFDPRLPEGGQGEANIGDVADDLADVYRDLHDGLTLFRAGHHEAAEYQWAWSFRHHWGRHAAAALHALHCWFADEAEWA